MSLFALYLLTSLDSLSLYFIFLTTISVAFIVLNLMRYFHASCSIRLGDKEQEGSMANSYKWLKSWAIISIVLAFFATAIPSNRNAYMILGGYYATNYITNSSAAKQLPDNILNAANAFLKDYAVDTAKQVIKETKEAIKDVKK